MHKIEHINDDAHGTVHCILVRQVQLPGPSLPHQMLLRDLGPLSTAFGELHIYAAKIANNNKVFGAQKIYFCVATANTAYATPDKHIVFIK